MANPVIEKFDGIFSFFSGYEVLPKKKIINFQNSVFVQMKK